MSGAQDSQSAPSSEYNRDGQFVWISAPDDATTLAETEGDGPIRDGNGPTITRPNQRQSQHGLPGESHRGHASRHQNPNFWMWAHDIEHPLQSVAIAGGGMIGAVLAEGNELIWYDLWFGNPPDDRNGIVDTYEEMREHVKHTAHNFVAATTFYLWVKRIEE